MTRRKGDRALMAQLIKDARATQWQSSPWTFARHKEALQWIKDRGERAMFDFSPLDSRLDFFKVAQVSI